MGHEAYWLFEKSVGYSIGSQLSGFTAPASCMSSYKPPGGANFNSSIICSRGLSDELEFRLPAGH